MKGIQTFPQTLNCIMTVLCPLREGCDKCRCTVNDNEHRVCFNPVFNIRMVNEDNITKTVGAQARYLAPLERRFLHSAMFTALDYFFVLVMNFCRQTQVGCSVSKLSRRHTIMFEMHLQGFFMFSQTKRINNLFIARAVSLIGICKE